MMRFILRLLLIIAVGAYLCQHYWPLLRVQIPRLASGNSKWLDQVPRGCQQFFSEAAGCSQRAT